MCALCFRQLPLNNKQKFEFLDHLTDGERLLSLVVEPLDFHDATFSV